ncbi:MAG: hypothetical protein KH338_03795 [Oscillospiraceae bacterium]|nr:hypothetical protein [Oscillospiraceae bacterium]
MDETVIRTSLVLEKRMYALLVEGLDLTRQLADAVDRGDPVAMRLVLSMRAEPVEKLRSVRQLLEEQKNALPAEDSVRLAALLNGEAAQRAEEGPLAEQVAANRRLLTQLFEMDKVVSLKLGKDESYYQK